MNPVVEVLEFVFSSFWRWLGTVVLLTTTAGALRSSVQIVKQRVTK